jgi:hypothetical protein
MLAERQYREIGLLSTSGRILTFLPGTLRALAAGIPGDRTEDTKIIQLGAVIARLLGDTRWSGIDDTVIINLIEEIKK